MAILSMSLIFASLQFLPNISRASQLRLCPISGRFTQDTFHISADCILVFAAIGRHDAAAVDPVGLRAAMVQFGDRFVPLIFGVGE